MKNFEKGSAFLNLRLPGINIAVVHYEANQNVQKSSNKTGKTHIHPLFRILQRLVQQKQLVKLSYDLLSSTQTVAHHFIAQLVAHDHVLEQFVDRSQLILVK